MKKLLAMLLTVVMVLSLMSVVTFAETTDPTVIATILPEAYAQVAKHIQGEKVGITITSTDNTRPSPDRYYATVNSLMPTPDGAVNKKMWARHVSNVVTYDLPLVEDITKITSPNFITQFHRNNNASTLRVFATTDDMPVKISGTYEADSDEFTALKDITDKFWGSKGKKDTVGTVVNGYTLVHYLSIPKGASYNLPDFDIPDTYLATLKAAGTGRLTMGSNSRYIGDYGHSFSYADTFSGLTVTYSNDIIVDYLKTAASVDELTAKITEIGEKGILLSDNGTTDDDTDDIRTSIVTISDYAAFTDAQKSALYADLANCSDWTSFKASINSIASGNPVVTLDSYVADINYSITVDGTTYASDNTIIIYGTVKGNPATFGYMLQQLNEGASVGTAQLKFEGSVTKDGKFAIRVIGAGITSGSYNAWPFYTTSESDTAVESETKTEIAVN